MIAFAFIIILAILLAAIVNAFAGQDAVEHREQGAHDEGQPLRTLVVLVGVAAVGGLLLWGLSVGNSGTEECGFSCGTGSTVENAPGGGS